VLDITVLDSRVDEKPGSWVRRLGTDDRGRHDYACSEQTRREFTERLGPSAVAWSVVAAREIASAVVGTPPRLPPGVGERRAVGKGIEGGVLCILASVYSGSVVDPATTPEVSQTAREFVQLGVPLHEVWAQVRQAHRRLVDRLVTACQDLVPVSAQTLELQHMFRLAFECVDALVEGLGEAYAVESDRWHATAAAVREELVNAVLSCDTALDLDAVAQKLRYELRHRHHVGVVVWQHGSVAPETTRLQDTALAWLEASGAQQTLLMPRGQSLLYAWGNRRGHFAPAEPRVNTAQPQVSTARPQVDGVRVAVGSAGYGAAGFRDTHREAGDAHRVALAMPGLAGTVVPFSSVSLLATLSQDTTRLRRFMARELGELAADDPNTRELRRTLRAYLKTRNAKEAASQLVVARNTVAYRLRRAEELRGMRTDERQLELWVALMLIDAMGAEPG
jgi:sugar diacid utilization regulator